MDSVSQPTNFCMWQWCMRNDHLLEEYGSTKAFLDEAFTYALDSNGARHCFHACGYALP